MKVCLIGGTGFVGSYIVDALLTAGHQPRLLVRGDHMHKVRQPDHCECVPGDIADLAAVEQCMRDCDALIYLIGILRAFPKRGITFENLQFKGFSDCLGIARRHGIRRVILMSANGVARGAIPYQDTKARAEALLQQTDFEWTVMAPSVIFGDPRGRMEFCTQLKRDLVDPPIPAALFFPGFRMTQAGRQPMSPVHVGDVAAAFVRSLPDPQTHHQRYVLAGPVTMSWAEIIRTIARASGKPTKWLVPVPAWGIKTVARLFESQPWFPLTADQVDMLMQGNQGDSERLFRQLDIKPTAFDQAALAYLNT